jgi:2-keto-3-deoxy-L-fuconate dehydrogenase
MPRLAGKRALVTQASDYMGPAITSLFRAEGAEVVASLEDPRPADAPARIVASAGAVDILIANLACPPLSQAADAIGDDEWSRLFDSMVTPLMRVVRGVLPQMLERKSGKIVVMTSAAPLRGIPRHAAYCAARGAQNAFVRAVGLEVASRGVQVNAVAQNYVQNPTYYPPERAESDAMKQHVARHVPAGRLAEGRESAELALFLASDASDFICGQIVPFAGGWTTTTG